MNNMKKVIAISIGFVWALLAFAQVNESAPMDFFIKKEELPPMLNIVPNSVQFIDANNNNVIDANEICKFRFTITNDGRGDGHNCVARVNMTGNTKGMTFPK